MLPTRLAELRDERATGGGWFVHLAPGWQRDGAHSFGEDTLAAVMQTMLAVRPCACDDCIARLAPLPERTTTS